MKKHLLTLCLLILGLTTATTLLTGCGDDFYYTGSNGVQGMRDSRLYGDWKLIQYNGAPVADSAANYLELFRGGSGFYYYFNRGVLVQERINYWVQPGGNPSSNYQINIQYSDGTASTMNYWFTDNNTRLWMQWHTNQGAVTYVYAYVNSIP